MLSQVTPPFSQRDGLLEGVGVLKLESKRSGLQVIDCARNGNMGCDGGDTCNLLDWLVASKTSIEPEKMYPFTWQTQSCKLKGLIIMFLVASMVGQENMLMTLLASHGPVVVAVNALNWQNYLGGIIQFHCDGGVNQLNHAVQLVGYDRSGPTPFYIARNSWGADFGDRGFLYLAIGSNICDLCRLSGTTPSIPVDLAKILPLPCISSPLLKPPCPSALGPSISSVLFQ
uniref:Peptidase C1A papain C-terminal domain-containing protein n=1 Tax=Timema genevievae TaxID=629358 RepID=A0A7R9PML7_TIMGE|nr:unnamed protein product [Timema genevievae]